MKCAPACGNGWLRQTTDMKANGQDVPGTREAVFAIGPGAMYNFSPQDHLMFNAYFPAAQPAAGHADGAALRASLSVTAVTG